MSFYWERGRERHAPAQVNGNGLAPGWRGPQEGGAGGLNGGPKRPVAGSINVRTDNVAATGAGTPSYHNISPDSVCAPGLDAVNGLGSPARRAPSGVSEWGAVSDGTGAVNSRDQLLSHQRITSSAGSPHAQQQVPRSAPPLLPAPVLPGGSLFPMLL